MMSEFDLSEWESPMAPTDNEGHPFGLEFEEKLDKHKEVMDNLDQEEIDHVESYIYDLVKHNITAALEEFKKDHVCIKVSGETKQYLMECFEERINSEDYPETSDRDCVVNMLKANHVD